MEFNGIYACWVYEWWSWVFDRGKGFIYDLCVFQDHLEVQGRRGTPASQLPTFGYCMAPIGTQTIPNFDQIWWCQLVPLGQLMSVGISIFSQSHSHFRLKPVIISGSSTVQQLLERSELREGETRPGPQSPEWVSRGISMGVFYGIFRLEFRNI